MDSASEAKLAAVSPRLATLIRKMADQLASEGTYIRVTQALRTVAEQDALYAQGRTAPGSKVTNCPGGMSYHNYGLAVDCVPSEHGIDVAFVPDWNAQHPTWKRMEEIGQSLGLNVGAYWRTFPDAPHFQLTGKFPVGRPDSVAMALLRTGGLAAVWSAVDATYQNGGEQPA
jgi:peptidoglycan LD-endopeptidase CwlK